MVLSFFRRGTSAESDMLHILAGSVAMMADARHSFDLATLALLTTTDSDEVADDIRASDDRINRAEHDLRSELVMYVSEHGADDISEVLGFILLLKKIERIGDQAKNILDLALSGVNLAANPDIDHLMAERRVVSALFAEAAELMNDPDEGDAALEEFCVRASALAAGHQDRIDGFLTSQLPGHMVVPLAIYFRYLKRIVANLVGIVRTAADPVPDSDAPHGPGGIPDLLS